MTTHSMLTAAELAALGAEKRPNVAGKAHGAAKP